MATKVVTTCDHCQKDCSLDHLEVTRTGMSMTLGKPNMIISGDENITFCDGVCLLRFFSPKVNL